MKPTTSYAPRATRMRILLVEDETILRVSLAKELAKVGHLVDAHDRPQAALAALAENVPDVVVADIRMPGMDGFEFMEQAQKTHSDLPFIFMTAFGTVRDAVRAMRLGAYDYLTKPFEAEELLLQLRRIGQVRALYDENAILRKRVERMSSDDELGTSRAMAQLLAELPLVASSDETVLLTGETGTGKEHLGRIIHARSAREAGPFVQVSCAALSAELIESELFGHEKGSFTGASGRVIGRFERAQGGSLLLDEVDDVPLAIQVKLLEVLQNSTVERVGGQRPIPVDVRVIAATKIDLMPLVKAGRFRPDLYYRLNVLPLQLPPLRDRREDIPGLVDRFLLRYSADRAFSISPDALDELIAYPWPGNIRELENLVKRLIVHAAHGHIDVDAIPAHVRHAASVARTEPSQGRGRYEETVARVERDLLIEALRRSGGNRTRAAEDLGLAPSTLRDKLAKLGIEA